MKYFSMFTGVGGFELGIQRAHDSKKAQSERDQESRENMPLPDGKLSTHWRSESPTCIGVCENNKYASQLLEQKFKGVKNYGDATTIKPEELPDFDLLVGGFPCQAFSIAGKRRGFEDTRGTLFYEIARIIKVKQPRLLLLENVKGLLNHDKGNTFTQILSALDELGYDVEWQVINSKHFGVPQNRERVFIKGCLRGSGGRKIFPIFGGGGSYPKEITNQVSDAQRIYTTSCAKTLKGMGGGQGAKTGLYLVPIAQRGRNPENHSQRIAGQYQEQVFEENKAGTTNCLTSVQKDNLVLDKRGDPSWTVRRLTPTECERLQGFPDGWTEGFSDTQRYKMMGNAVTVNVITAIMVKLL